MNEEWKDVPGFEGIYKVSNLGRVKSFNKWRGANFRILSDRVSKKGYNTAVLYKDKKSKNFRVHQLVAMAFLNHNPNGMTLQVDHINGDKMDNRLSNLQILTEAEHREKTYSNLKSTSSYIGISWSKHANKWRSDVWVNGKQKHLGYFNNEIDAYEARLNFLK